MGRRQPLLSTRECLGSLFHNVFIRTTSIPLIAFIPDLSDPSKLRVGPSFLETIYGEDAVSFFGDYWVVAVGMQTLLLFELTLTLD